MERNLVALLIIGIVFCAALAIFNFYIGGIAFILVLTLAMSFQIMQDTRSLADVGVTLSANAKHITVINRGNVPAFDIHVSIVPLNREFEIGTLDVEKSQQFMLDTMINEAKAVVSFRVSSGQNFQKSYQLSSTGKGDDDILKPMFPLFRQE
jgi:hypothetical protein